MADIRFQRFAAGNISASEGVFKFKTQSVTPRVSCLMVTRGNMGFINSAYRQFKAQSWPNKELVIVAGTISAALKTLCTTDDDVILVEAPPGYSLGELRNSSIAHATGDFICQWDDDDLYDPHRISVSLGVLSNASVGAVFLQRIILWWAARKLLSISQIRLWEGSIFAHRSAVPVYPALPKGEDTFVANWITQHHDVALIDCPELYCYRITGENTWHQEHFNEMFTRASRTFAPDEIGGVLQLPCFR